MTLGDGMNYGWYFKIIITPFMSDLWLSFIIIIFSSFINFIQLKNKILKPISFILIINNLRFMLKIFLINKFYK